ncbi:MAG: hypothetical protein V4724_10120 [Pseudomonadota bacterium]
MLFTLAACGDKYTAPSLYQATTPDCKTWADESHFELPKGITVVASSPVGLPDGGVEFGLTYMLPHGTNIKLTSRTFQVTQPKGAPIAAAEVVSIYQRGTNRKPEIVDVIKEVPLLMFAIGSAEATQFRYRLQLKGKQPERFDLVPPAVIISGERYPVRTFTYRYFEDRKAYGMCT